MDTIWQHAIVLSEAAEGVMPRVPSKAKTVRKLVTLPVDLADRVEKYRALIGASSESDALKSLIEDGLKLRDTPADLLRQLESATKGVQRISEIINILVTDHPLVRRTSFDSDELLVFLKVSSDEPDQRFRYSRSKQLWYWEAESQSGYNSWQPITRVNPQAKPAAAKDDLDDEIPF